MSDGGRSTVDGRRTLLCCGVLLCLVTPPACAQSPGEERFFKECPRGRRVHLHHDANPWDLHALLYTAVGMTELEVIRVVDWAIDLPLPGRPLRPLDRTARAVRATYHRLPPWIITQRVGQLVDALQLPELSFGDVSSAYSMATGGSAGPGSGTLLRVNKLVDWVQHVSGDVNRVAGWPVGRPQGLIGWSLPARSVDGLQGVVLKTFHQVSLLGARLVEGTFTGVETAGEGIVNIGYRRPHQETTVFLRLPISIYRAHELWILEHQDRLTIGRPHELAASAHAALAHHRRARPVLALPDVDLSEEPQGPVIVMTTVRLLARAPAPLQSYVVPAAWVLDEAAAP